MTPNLSVCYGRYIFIEKMCQCRYNDSENGIGYVIIRERVILVLDIPAEKIDVTVGMKFGCLQILDEGAEYLQVMDERISNIKEKKQSLLRRWKKESIRIKIGLG